MKITDVAFINKTIATVCENLGDYRKILGEVIDCADKATTNDEESDALVQFYEDEKHVIDLIIDAQEQLLKAQKEFNKIEDVDGPFIEY